MASDRSGCRGVPLGIILYNPLHPLNQFGAVAIQCHDICLVCRQTVVNIHLTPASFIQHRYFYTIPKTAPSIHKDNIHILDECAVANLIIGDIILHIFDIAVITDHHII